MTVSDVSATSATFTATLDPGGLSTSYHFLLTSMMGDSETTVTQTLATTSPTTVTFNDDQLEPNGKFYIQLVAQNSAGSNTGPLGNPFATPVAPSLPIRLTVHPLQYSIGATISFTGITSGSVSADVFDTGYLEDSAAGSAKFSPYTDPFQNDAPTVEPNRRISMQAIALRNARWRAVLSGENNGLAANAFAQGPIRYPSYSKPVTVIVYPLLNFGTDRPNNGLRIRVGASAVVHRLPRGYRGEPVYIYLSSSARGPWRRIGAPRLRPAGEGEFLGSENLEASISYPDPNAVYVNGCVRHEILRDMGKPFFDSACGASIIKRFG